MGNCFAKDLETYHLGIAMSGAWHKNPWNKQIFKPDYFTVKGIIDSVFNPLGIQLDYVSTSKIDAFHPYKQANILYNKHVLGQIAEIHPTEAKLLGIDTTVICEINLTPLLAEESKIDYKPITKFPNISRDLAVVVNEHIQASDLISLIKQTVKKNLVSIDIFDVYQGSHIETGKKSVALNLVFNDSDKTLTTEDVDLLMKKVTGRLSFTFQAVVRS